jgi:hypothetical protein
LIVTPGKKEFEEAEEEKSPETGGKITGNGAPEAEMENGERVTDVTCGATGVTCGVTAVTCGVTVTCGVAAVTLGGMEVVAAWKAALPGGAAGARGGMEVVAAWKAALPGGTSGAGEGEVATEHGGAADTRRCWTERPSTSPKGKGGAGPQRSPPASMSCSATSAMGRSAPSKVGAAMWPPSRGLGSLVWARWRPNR